MPTCGVLVFSADEIGPHKTRLRHPTRSCRSVSLLHVFHINPPAQWIAGPFEMVALPDGTMAQGYGNVPAVIVVFLMPFQSTVGARGSDSGNGGDFALMYSLGWSNWLRLIVWLAIGQAIYFGYGRWHSHLRQGGAANTR